MKLFYGWVIVGVGIVVTCIGMGTMMSLGVFMQPMSQDMGWSRAGISFAAVLNFLAMGFGSFFWGSLSDRFGTRAIVLAGGVLLGIGLIAGSQAATLLQFQLLFGVLVGLAAGSFYTPMIATATRWFTRHRSLAVALVSSGLGFGSFLIAPMARSIITSHDWRTAMLDLGGLAWLVIIPVSLLVRRPPMTSQIVGAAAGTPGGDYTMAQVLRTPQFAAIALTHFACCAAHSGPIFHMVSYAIDCGVPSMAAATVFGVAGLAALSGRILCGLIADRVGAKRTLVTGLAVQALAVSLYLVTQGTVGLLRAGGAVRPVLRRRDAALRDPGARVFRRQDHGHRVRHGGNGVDTRHGDRPVGRGLAVRHLRQLLLAVYRFVRHRARRRGDRLHLPAAGAAAGRAGGEPGMTALPKRTTRA